MAPAAMDQRDVIAAGAATETFAGYRGAGPPPRRGNAVGRSRGYAPGTAVG